MPEFKIPQQILETGFLSLADSIISGSLTLASGALVFSDGTEQSTAGGGGSGTPGGSSGEIQYNNAGAFGGVSTLTFVGGTLRATGSFSGSLTGQLTGTASFTTTAATASIVRSTGSYGLATLNANNSTGILTISGSNTVGGSGYIDFLRVINNSAGATSPIKTVRISSNGNLEFLNSAYTSLLLALSDGGILYVGGGNKATTTDNDGTSNYLSFNENNSQIYDDGNLHIHSRGSSQALWVNANNGSIILGQQSPTSTGRPASAIIMSSGSSTTVKAYVNIYGYKVYTIGSYGYLATSGAGTGVGTTAPYSLYCDNRVEASEFDATSDERLKDIQGEIQLDEAIDLVNNITPIKYCWKDSEDKGLKTGYSAQQVEKAGFKHLIGHVPNEKLEATADSDNFTSPAGFQLTMNYDQVIPYHGVVLKHLLEKIQQLEHQIEQLK
jgi:hypothetical protein